MLPIRQAETIMSTTTSNGLIDSDIDPDSEIDVVQDVQEAIRRARAQERVIVTAEGQPSVAVIPLIDLKLLLRLEEEELDRIDAEDLRRIKESDEYHDRVSWDEVKVLSRV
jgi:PHD/YefM family antitoxin component YafN of YafNO toxin-antitoxin module